MAGDNTLDEPNLLTGFPDVALFEPFLSGIDVPGIFFIQHTSGFIGQSALHPGV